MKKTLLVMLFVAAVALAGSAQEINARFKLQNPTRFGNTIVPAGTYKFLSVSQGSGVVVVTPESGVGERVLLVSRLKEYNTPCAETSLHATRRGGQWTATSICVAESSTTLTFGDSPNTAPITTAALAGSK